MDMQDEVIIVPCGGIDKPEGIVTQYIALLLTEKYQPNHTQLVALPPLVAGVNPNQQVITEKPSIVIDGCAQRCATKIVAKHHGIIRGKYLLSRFIQKHKLKPKCVSDIGSEGTKLAELVAQEASEKISDLIGAD